MKLSAEKPTNKNKIMKNTTHTLGAIRAAEIITGGKYGDKKTYPTTYGRKTVEGIADIIDRETAAFELLVVTKRIASYCERNSVPEIQGIACDAFEVIEKATANKSEKI